MDIIGDAQFRVMCEMWGVDHAIIALKKMGMKASDEQIETARQKEAEIEKRWNSIFKPREQTV